MNLLNLCWDRFKKKKVIKNSSIWVTWKQKGNNRSECQWRYLEAWVWLNLQKTRIGIDLTWLDGIESEPINEESKQREF